MDCGSVSAVNAKRARRGSSAQRGLGSLLVCGFATASGCFVSLGEPTARSDAGVVGTDAQVEATIATSGSSCFGYEPDGARCDSFDDESSPAWWQPDHSAASPPALTRDFALSFPGSLTATVPAGSGTAFSRLLVLPPTEGFSRFRFRFAVRVDDEMAFTELAELRLEDTPTLVRRLVFYVTSNNTLRVNALREKTDPTQTNGTLGVLRKGQWELIEFDGNVDGLLRGSINGTELLSLPLTVVAGAAAGGAAFRIGIFMMTERPRARTFYFDDFAFRVDR